MQQNGNFCSWIMTTILINISLDSFNYFYAFFDSCVIHIPYYTLGFDASKWITHYNIVTQMETV